MKYRVKKSRGRYVIQYRVMPFIWIIDPLCGSFEFPESAEEMKQWLERNV